jgi:3-hydroxybutyryl-CoA dehydratase
VKIGDCADVSRTFSAQDLHDYAGLSDHEASAERVPEPLIGALFSYLLGVKLPGMGTMYLKQETRFLRDARIGEPLTAKVEITRLRPDKQLADLSTTCRDANGQLIASGRALVYIGDVASNPDRHE